LTGRYLAISKDGILTSWTRNLTRPEVQHITTPNCPVTALWVTCATFMPAANVLVVATTNCDMLFYVYSSERFERTSRVWQLPAAVTCLTYHCDAFLRVSLLFDCRLLRVNA
jgi:hypothetical protein